MFEKVSIADLPDQIVVSNRETQATPLVWDMPLPPHLDLERLVVNATYLRALHRWGGAIGSIVNAYDGDLTEHIQSVSGINEDGSAVGGKTSLGHKAPRSKGAYIDPVEGATSADVGKTILYHRLNKPELASLVADKKSEGEVSDEKAWASLLDGALRHSMREGAKRHLTRRDAFIWRLGAYNFMFWMIANDLTDPTSTWAKIDNGFYIVAQATKKLEANFKQKRFGIKTQPRLSVLPYASQVDRYEALNVMSRIPGLIRARK